MIYRIHKDGKFSTLSNVGAEDKRLSATARGVLWYLLTKPDGWTVNTKELRTAFPNGRDVLLRAQAELQANGYLTRSKFRNAAGRWPWEKNIYEAPRDVLQKTRAVAAPTPAVSPLFDDPVVTGWADERADFTEEKRQRREKQPRRKSPPRHRATLRGR